MADAMPGLLRSSWFVPDVTTTHSAQVGRRTLPRPYLSGERNRAGPAPRGPGGVSEVTPWLDVTAAPVPDPTLES